MASVRFGNIVTGIKGSVGGNTYRQSRNGWVLQAKSKGGNKAMLKSNPTLARLNNVIQGWQVLSFANRTRWQNAAQNFLFPDKWGNQVNITGRELYIKLVNHCINIGKPIPNPDTLDSSVNSGFPMIASIVYPSTATFQLSTPDATGFATLHIADKHLGGYPNFGRFGPILWGGSYTNLQVIDASLEFWSKYSYMRPGNVVSYGFQSYNSDGFKGNSYLVTVQVV